MKPWYESKTIWVNLLSIVAMTLTLVAEQAGALALPEGTVPYLMIALAIVNGVLRMVTSTAIAGTPAAERDHE